jgi:hypothetical protein
LLSLSRAYGPTPAFANTADAVETGRRLWPEGNPQGLRHTWDDMVTRLVTYIDGNSNRVVVRYQPYTSNGEPLIAATLVDEPDTGYIVVDTNEGGFGDVNCPSSYGMPCLEWFGPGQHYPNSDALLEDMGDTI